MILWTVVLGLTCVFYFLYRYFANQRKYWKSLGVIGPKPDIFWGNLKPLLNTGYPPPFQFRDWTTEYGKTYGIYEGARRVLVTSDLDLLHEVFVKKFDHFHGRKLPSLSGDVDKEPNVNVFAARGLRWKRLRTIVNPTLNVINLKKMLPTVQDSVKVLINRMEKHAEDGKPFDIFPYFQELSIDVIGRVVLGQDGTMQGNSPYIEMCKDLFDVPLTDPFEVASSLLPELSPLFCKASLAVNKPLLLDKMNTVVKERRENRVRIPTKAEPTFFEFLLDAEAEEGHHLDYAADFEKSALKVSKKLTLDEVVGQCFIFLVAGYDTTANSMAYASYLLATNPEKQAKLQAEIDDVCTDEEISYEQIFQIKYLDAVMKEGLRLYPLGAFANSRVCMKSCKLGNIPIEEGTLIQADVWSVHHDKDVWGDDADHFRPEW